MGTSDHEDVTGLGYPPVLAMVIEAATALELSSYHGGVGLGAGIDLMPSTPGRRRASWLVVMVGRLDM